MPPFQTESILLDFDGWLARQDNEVQRGLRQHLAFVPVAGRAAEKRLLASMYAVADATQLDINVVGDNWDIVRGGFAEQQGGEWLRVKDDNDGVHALLAKQARIRLAARGILVADPSASPQPSTPPVFPAPPLAGDAGLQASAIQPPGANPMQNPRDFIGPSQPKWMIDPDTRIKWELGPDRNLTGLYVSPVLPAKGAPHPLRPDPAMLQDTADPVQEDRVARNAQAASRLARMHYWQDYGNWLRWSHFSKERREEFIRVAQEHPEMSAKDIRTGMADAAKMDFTREADDHGKPFPDADVLSNGEVVVRPLFAFDAAAWEKAVSATSASPEAKARAIARRIQVRDELGEGLYDALLASKTFKNWLHGTPAQKMPLLPGGLTLFPLNAALPRREIPANPGQPDADDKNVSAGELVERFRHSAPGGAQALMQMESGAGSAFHGIGKGFWGFLAFLGLPFNEVSAVADAAQKRAAGVAEGLGGATWLNKVSAGVVGLAPTIASGGVFGAIGKAAGLAEATVSRLAFASVLAAQGSQTAGNAFIDARDAGLSPTMARIDAFASAAPEMFITALFGKSGAEALTAMGRTPRGIVAALKATGYGAIKELPEELLVTLAQAPAQFAIDPNYDLAGALFDTATTAPVVGGLMQWASHVSRRAQVQSAFDATQLNQLKTKNSPDNNRSGLLDDARQSTNAPLSTPSESAGAAVDAQRESDHIEDESISPENPAEESREETPNWRLPVSNGEWTGTPGDSEWRSNLPAVNKLTRNRPIRFRKGYIDLSPYEVTHYNFENLDGTSSDFDLADERHAIEMRFENAKAVREWRSLHKLSWHHHEDGRTLQLVPRALNAIPHRGGASLLRK